MEKLKTFSQDDSGAAAVEYSLLIAFITLVIFGAVQLLGNAVLGWFNRFNLS